MWSSITRLAPAGGTWGPVSADNPNGYRPARRSAKRGRSTGSIGHTFGERLDDELSYGDADDWHTPDYVPEADQRTGEILDELEGIPTDQWEDELTQEDYERVLPYKAEYEEDERRRERSADFQRELDEARSKLESASKAKDQKAISA